ncbi:type II toxin-antitoxin system RelE/ParE family toxin [Herbaspirillum sp. C7C2]|nr:type II toxin-antitoxin system RelE/ParE family toxin [Herbaspirillum sp. C7C2]
MKQRVARTGHGKAGGFRTIILYRTAERAFFVYGFAKNDRDNIDADEEVAFKKAAQHILRLTEDQLAALIAKGQLTEIDHHDQEIP